MLASKRVLTGFLQDYSRIVEINHAGKGLKGWKMRGIWWDWGNGAALR
jgi:hypothetical protein